MSHGIVKPIDRVFSTEGTEWHGLAEPVETLTRETVKSILPTIIRGGMLLDMGTAGTVAELQKSVASILSKSRLKGQEPKSPSEFARVISDAVRSTVKMPNHQGLVADYRQCYPELIDSEETSGGLVPLHIPKNSYFPIENGTIWDSMATALKDVDAKITCAGTLEAGRKFFVSARLGDGGKFEVNGDSFLANLNFLTSHDGELAVEAFDSTVRVVCMNTFRMSRQAAGEVGFKVYHNQNASLAMPNLGPLVNRILTGRAEFRTNLEYLASVPVSLETAREILLGYFVQVTGAKQLATNAFNATDSILALFRNGKGNKGASLYDLFNGATEHYSGGDGTGSDAKPAEKVYKGVFGRASDHKESLFNLLMAGESKLAEIAEAGREAAKLGKRERKTK